jgi:hypothetical protein
MYIHHCIPYVPWFPAERGAAAAVIVVVDWASADPGMFPAPYHHWYRRGGGGASPVAPRTPAGPVGPVGPGIATVESVALVDEYGAELVVIVVPDHHPPEPLLGTSNPSVKLVKWATPGNIIVCHPAERATKSYSAIIANTTPIMRAIAPSTPPIRRVHNQFVAFLAASAAASDAAFRASSFCFAKLSR